jgi:phosphate:Na+ symporter
LLLILIGLLITGLIQSSSATTGILIAMASVGLVGIESSIFIILGINIGTCVTALLAAIGTNVNAQRAAAIHLMFNIAGALIFGIILSISPIREGSLPFKSSRSIFPNEVRPQIAISYFLLT